MCTVNGISTDIFKPNEVGRFESTNRTPQYISNPLNMYDILLEWDIPDEVKEAIKNITRDDNLCVDEKNKRIREELDKMTDMQSY